METSRFLNEAQNIRRLFFIIMRRNIVEIACYFEYSSKCSANSDRLQLLRKLYR